MRKIRWGILGCGKIARKFASDLKWVEHSVCFAVASTDPNRALDFAKTYGFEQAFDSYQKLVESDVDVIYIATPHGFHYEHVMLCLNHKKAVLCEKAFALNSKQLQEMVSTARTNKIFLMEAFWTRFLPQYLKTSELLQGHAIGSIAMISADFGFKASEPPAPRLYEPRLGGGALLDIGIYPVFLAVSLFGGLPHFQTDPLLPSPEMGGPINSQLKKLDKCQCRARHHHLVEVRIIVEPEVRKP